MPRIILASKSKARQKLLKQIGLEFQVAASKAKESRCLKAGCASLVISNALNKAKAAAKRFKTGIVIGADTIVLAGKKVVGKPKNKKEAVKVLKLLCRKPQWVYTGLAVVDIGRNKVFTDYDKTKVYMQALSDSQIKNYFRKISPMDKAGAFDIQGLGSIFIDRVEGCFYNVVGLPVSKLAKMLKKAGVEII